MADNIIHIGYPKTGTTFLQKNIYPFLQGIDYYDYKVADQLFYDIIFLDDLDYDQEKNAARFKEYLGGQATTLFSFESLAGAPYIYKGANRSRIPNRLKEIGFDKVIISIRNQSDMIDSLYRQYVVQGGVMKFRDFIDLEEKWLLSIRPFHLGYLNYSKLIKLYFNVFGKENVLVVQQESLRNDPEKLSSDLMAFTGASQLIKGKKGRSNESLTNLSIGLLRFCNHFIFTSQKPNNLIWNKINTWFVRRVFAVVLDPFIFRFFSSKKSFLKSGQREKISSYYEQDNVELKSLTGIDFNNFHN